MRGADSAVMTGFDRLSYQSRWLQVAPERKFLLWLLLMALAFTLPAWGQALVLRARLASPFRRVRIHSSNNQLIPHLNGEQLRNLFVHL